MENHHVFDGEINELNSNVPHSYVKLPEGISKYQAQYSSKDWVKGKLTWNLLSYHQSHRGFNSAARFGPMIG